MRRKESLLLLELTEIELLLELVNTSACINKLLFAGEEGVALRADINLEVFLDGLGLIDRAASASDRCVLVIGMDALLHDGFPRFLLGPDISGAESIFFIRHTV